MTAGGQWTTTGTLTQTSTGTCLQIVRGTQIVLVSVTCFCTVTGHMIVFGSTTWLAGGVRAPSARTGPVCISQTVSGTHLTQARCTISQTVWQTFLTHGSATVRQVVTGTWHDRVSLTIRQVVTGTCLTLLLGHHPAGGDRHPLDAGLRTIRVTVQGTCLHRRLADRPGDRVGHLLDLVLGDVSWSPCTGPGGTRSCCTSWSRITGTHRCTVRASVVQTV